MPGYFTTDVSCMSVSLFLYTDATDYPHYMFCVMNGACRVIGHD